MIKWMCGTLDGPRPVCRDNATENRSSWIADTFHNGSSVIAGMIGFVISGWYSRCVAGDNVSFVASSHSATK